MELTDTDLFVLQHVLDSYVGDHPEALATTKTVMTGLRGRPRAYREQDRTRPTAVTVPEGLTPLVTVMEDEKGFVYAVLPDGEVRERASVRGNSHSGTSYAAAGLVANVVFDELSERD